MKIKIMKWTELQKTVRNLPGCFVNKHHIEFIRKDKSYIEFHENGDVLFYGDCELKKQVSDVSYEKMFSIIIRELNRELN